MMRYLFVPVSVITEACVRILSARSSRKQIKSLQDVWGCSIEACCNTARLKQLILQCSSCNLDGARNTSSGCCGTNINIVCIKNGTVVHLYINEMASAMSRVHCHLSHEGVYGSVLRVGPRVVVISQRPREKGVVAILVFS